jgi:hypothetical protein
VFAARAYHRGAPQQLECRIRWEGDECAESWEPISPLDACSDTVDDYWRTLNAAGTRLPHHDSPLVAARRRLERVRFVQLSGVEHCICPIGRPYTLPSGVNLLTSPLPPHELASTANKGLGVLVVWEVTISGSKVKTWYEGVITRAPRDRRPPFLHHRVRFSDMTP